MPKAKTTNKKMFNSLSYDKQIQEVKKMAKRANVRLSLLEETNTTNDIYKQADYFNSNQGREKNRFYEGKNYKTQKDLKETYNALSNFLNNKKSTLGGIKETTYEKIDKLVQKGDINQQEIQNMSKKEREYASSRLAYHANKRITELEKNNIDYGAIKKAEHYNNTTGRDNNRFYRGRKFKSEKDLNIHIENEVYFLNLKTSTMKGIEEKYTKMINTFRNHGVNIPQGKEQDFLDFLEVNQFNSMKKYADSNQLIQTYVNARNKGEDVKNINEAFDDFLNNDLTLDEVQERLNVAEWKQGGLLK